MKTNVRRRSIVHEFEFDQGLRHFFGEVRRADAIVADWMGALARSPERGFAVQGAPEYLGLPIHTESGSFLVIYWFDEDRVYCIGMRRIPSGIYGGLSSERRKLDS